MDLIVIEKSIFSNLVVITILLSLFKTSKSSRSSYSPSEASESGKESSSKHKGWQAVIEVINAIVALGFLIFAVIYFFQDSNAMVIFIICISAPMLLNQLLGTLFSIGMVAKIVGSSGKGNLTPQE